MQRIGIVNRGEAAVRFLTALDTLRREDPEAPKSVALYIQADEEAHFLSLADSKQSLGSKRSAYLDGPLVLAALRKTGCDAAWLGWGFAAEDAEFAACLEEGGITLLGPRSETMRRLGDKVQAKRLAEELEIPVLPWALVSDPETLLQEAERIGYPLMVKAAGGGGGRGIRRVDAPDELRQACQRVQEEVARSFGDGDLFLERFQEHARHIEVQIFGDGEGGVQSLGLRDCSLQRRRQKVVEECPPSHLPPKQAQALETAALRLCKTLRYRSAGTVEFLYDPQSGEAWLMEVNTRLQVEHPITEEVYGVDLLRAQIELARERPSLLEGAQPRGCAIEARVCAEDAHNDFSPAPGRLVRLAFSSGPGIRIDTGYAEGDRISAEFDSMIAKVIAWGPSRESALSRLSQALEQTRIVVEGGACNLSFLRSLLANPEVCAGRGEIGLVERLPFSLPDGREAALIAAALDRFLAQGDRQENGSERHEVEVGGRLFVYRESPHHFRITSKGRGLSLSYRPDGPYQSWLSFNGATHRIERAPGDTNYLVNGEPHRVAQESRGAVLAPSAAMLLEQLKPEGAEVLEGQPLLLLESMKMEIKVKAPVSGRVKEHRVSVGSQVKMGQVLSLIESEGESGESVLSQPVWESSPLKEKIKERLLAGIIGWDVEPQQFEFDLQNLGEEECLSWLGAAVEVAAFFDRRPEASEALSEAVSPSIWLETARRQGLKALPPRRRALLQALLERHGVKEQSGAAFQGALLRIRRAGAALSRSSRAVVAALKLSQGLSVEVLDRLSALDFEQHAAICEAAKNARYEHFERPVLETFRHESMERAKGLLEQLRKGESDWRALLLIPDSILAIFAPAAAEGCVVAQEGVARRLEADTTETSCVAFEAGGRNCHRLGEGERASVVCVCHPEEIESVMTALRTQPPFSRLNLVLLASGEPLYADTLEEQAHRLGLGREDVYAELSPWREIILISVNRRGPPCVRRYRADGQERKERRDILPNTERRLDLDRLTRFDYRRLPSGEGVILFMAQARENPDDVRLLAYAEVRNLQRRSGSPLYLPEVDRVFYEAVYAMQAEREIHDPRRRLQWNRLILRILPVVPLRARVVYHYMKRLAPAARHIGMEKLVVRFRCAEPESPEGISPLMDLSIFDLSGGDTNYAIRSASHRPLMPRTSYESKVVAARRRGLNYPYEIIFMLESGDMGPSGNFEEFDLDVEGRSQSVWQRLRGHNEAGIIFGIMRSRVPRLPNGLVRVLLFSDPTRRMGALAEPECLRVIAALDLAEQMGVPLEWVSVSAGALIDWETGTENLDWTARVLRRIIRFTQAGGEINIIVAGTCVGAQSYWNAEATMLMHTRGLLIMTEQASMVLTGKRALDFSGCVSGEDERAIGGYTSVMGPNGQGQAYAPNLAAAYRLLYRYYDLSYVPPKAKRPPRRDTRDDLKRDISLSPYPADLEHGFKNVGQIFSREHNPDRKRPFAVRPVMAAVADRDLQPLERWAGTHKAETTVVWETRIGGFSALLIGVENRLMPRLTTPSMNGPQSFSGGTLYPRASWKMARAINAASGRRPVVILANLSGFDGSPESLMDLQLEFGAEIGRAVVNFKGLILFVVTSRYHGGAYVVFSQALNPGLKAVALEGSYASVIGGAPAAAVVFLRELRRQSRERQLPQAQVLGELAGRFDNIHTVERALEVGSIQSILKPSALRAYIIQQLEEDYEEGA